jgi:hypothetical protein
MDRGSGTVSLPVSSVVVTLREFREVWKVYAKLFYSYRWG